MLSGFYFLQNGPYIIVVQLFCSQSDYRLNISYLLDVCPHLDFVAMGTLLLEWSSREGIGIAVFSV
jgi:hypothetical protein